MPHSPRLNKNRVWLLNSGHGQLNNVDPRTGTLSTVAHLPGYTRGLAMAENLAFVGLSKIRETSTFSGVPIADDREKLKCGVVVVDMATGAQVSLFEFQRGVDEIFDVQLIRNVRLPALRGPYSFAGR